MNILVDVLKQICKFESEYDISILVLKDSNFADLNLSIFWDNELIDLKTIRSYDLRKSDERFKSDLRCLYQFFDVITMEERKED